MTQCNLVKEFYKLLKNVNKMSDGQATVSDWDDENVATFKLQIKPSSGVYKGGTFCFKVTLGDEFPQCAPQIRCETPIYHPNIDPTEECDETNICLNMFNSDEWQEAYGMDGVVQGLLFLFYEPNLEDPLSPYFDGTMLDDFEENVRLSLKGEIVEGVQYPVNFDGEIEVEGDGEAKTDSQDNKNFGVKDETADDNVPKGDNPTGEHVNDDEKVPKETTSENKCTSELCNTTNTSNKDLSPEMTGENADDHTQEPQKGSTLGVTVKPKEYVTLTSVIPTAGNDRPDVIPQTSDDCSASCPDVVAMTTDNFCQSHESFDSRNVEPLFVQTKMSDVVILDKVTRRPSVPLRSYDSVLPEMNLVFAVLHKVTETVDS